MTRLRQFAARVRRDRRRRLVLHIGMGKTGTSALQVALVRNRQRLADQGVDYPPHTDDDVARALGVTNGNGPALANLLGSELAAAPADLTQAQSGLRALCTGVALSTFPITLYSSELLYRFDPNHLAVLGEEADRAGIELRVVVYVRDIAPYFVSSYSERVKRNGYSGTFDEYLEGGDDFGRRVALFQPRLTRLVDAVGRSRVQILHYDSVGAQLFPSFVRDVLGLTDSGGWELPPSSVNRGLTAQEVELLRHLNRTPGARGPGWSGESLIADGAARRPTAISSAALASLEARFGPEVTWLNAEFLEGRMEVRGDVQLLSDDRSAQ
ncbi:hypothetical protein [Sporichthya sp.]|uniref:hypothetical protein n=1 Tax=Sporichthya sp. TaxID=65475 RepID=UPI00178FCA31|nr:hypothetical protein [Sporichthya sp.]MBA3744832.1 hypothetical protein [Sporichthya sp.]